MMRRIWALTFVLLGGMAGCVLQGEIGLVGWPCQEEKDCLDLVCCEGYCRQVCTSGNKCGNDEDCKGLLCCEETCRARCCERGQTRPCYTGNPDHVGKGICKAGVEGCKEDGHWSGECKGEVRPRIEICDNKDNDCNGQTDEGLKCDCIPGDERKCYSGDPKTRNKGVCTDGKQSCTDKGRWGECKGQVLSAPEICDNKDNDCDGQTDEELERECYTGPGGTRDKGLCQGGKRICKEGDWGDCQGEVTPVAEKCDNKDNDCDGSVDEGNPEGDGECTIPGKKGDCGKGKTVCQGGQLNCLPANKPTPETCDGKDNDCDGSIDENLSQKCYSGPSNTKGQGECKEGSQTCSAGMWGSCTGEVTPQPEACDGKDNDCNGQTDENLSQKCSYSGPPGTEGIGECKASAKVCSAGSWGACTGEVKPQPEACDGKDNDCNGQTDENLSQKCSYSGPSGTEGVGECKASVRTCQGGIWSACQGEVVPQPEACDGKDNDCNGSIDENLSQKCYTGPASARGKGECKEGTQTCQGGSWGACVGEVLPAGADYCGNNKDDNCNGQVDEGCSCSGTQSRSCYEGSMGCQNKYTTSRTLSLLPAGQPMIFAFAGLPAAGGSVTVTIDLYGDYGTSSEYVTVTINGTSYGQYTGSAQDCNTTPNRKSYTLSASAIASGQLSVQLVNSTAVNPTLCTASKNEAIVSLSYTRSGGVYNCSGICKAGTQSCVNGQWSLCQGQVLPTAESCDGKDNDCDGTIDEDLLRSCYSGTNGCSGKPGSSTPYSASKTVLMTSDGQSMVFPFSNLPLAAGTVEVTVDLYGDYDSPSTEYATIWINNISYGQHSGDGKTMGCNKTKPRRKTYQLSHTAVQKGTLTVLVANQPGVQYNICKNDNPRVIVTVQYLKSGYTCKGECRGGVQSCSNGSWSSCQGEVVPASESCDGKDNDCNGKIDDGISCP